MDDSAALAGFFAMFWLCVMGVALLSIVGMWILFTKAGKPGWAAIVPIYNLIVMLEIAGKPLWWVLLLIVPILNIVISFLMLDGFAKAFGKTTAFAVGLFFLPMIFFLLLAFGDAQYRKTPAMA